MTATAKVFALRCKAFNVPGLEALTYVFVLLIVLTATGFGHRGARLGFGC